MRVAKKMFFIIPLVILCLLVGGTLAYGTEKSVTLVKQYIPFTSSPTPLPTSTPTPTKIEPTASPSATVTPTLIRTPTPTVTEPDASPSASITPTINEKLSIQAFDPPFLWADYATTGPTEIILTGTGFTSETKVELFGPHDPFEKISSNDIVYPISQVTIVSSRQLKGKLPSGLYNAHYSLRVTNPDKTYVVRDSILVVSGSTRDAENQ